MDAHHLTGGVDIAAGNGDSPGIHAATGLVNDTRVGPTHLYHVSLSGNILALGQLHEKLHHLGVTDHGSVHHLHRSPLARQTAGGVFGPKLSILTGNIYCNAIVWVNGPGGGFRPAQPHLFLAGKDEVQIIGALLQTLHSRQQYQTGNSVVQIGACQHIPRLKDRGAVDGHVSNLHHLFCLLPGGCP